MKIEMLSENNIADVYCCLGERREFFKEEISESLGYMKEKLKQGWLTYGVYDDTNKPVGMAILIPSSDPLSPIVGENLYYFHCLDVNKDVRKREIGKRLIERTTNDVKALGGKGLVVDCYGEYWMPCEYFKKMGFEPAKVFPDHSLLLKKISKDAQVEYTEMSYKGDLPKYDIRVDIQYSGSCPYMNNNYRKVKDIVKKLEPNAIIRERVINTKEDVKTWGGSGFYVNGKSVSAGPVDEEELKKAIEEAKHKA